MSTPVAHAVKKAVKKEKKILKKEVKKVKKEVKKGEKKIKRKVKQKKKNAANYALRGHGSYFSDAVGHVVGGGVSSLLSGFGDYRQRAAKGTYTPMGGGPGSFVGSRAPRVNHREFIANVVSSASFVTTTYPINPAVGGSNSLFPWLSTIASSFQQYRILGMELYFESTSGFISSTQNLGTVMMSTQYEVGQTPFNNSQSILNTEYSTNGKPVESFYHPIECDPKQTTISILYTRSANATPTSFTDLGQFQISTEGMPTSGEVIGKLWCTYDIELIKPTLPESIGGYMQLVGYCDSTAFTGGSGFALHSVCPISGASNYAGISTAPTTLNSYNSIPTPPEFDVVSSVATSTATKVLRMTFADGQEGTYLCRYVVTNNITTNIEQLVSGSTSPDFATVEFGGSAVAGPNFFKASYPGGSNTSRSVLNTVKTFTYSSTPGYVGDAALEFTFVIGTGGGTVTLDTPWFGVAVAGTQVNLDWQYSLVLMTIPSIPSFSLEKSLEGETKQLELKVSDLSKQLEQLKNFLDNKQPRILSDEAIDYERDVARKLRETRARIEYENSIREKYNNGKTALDIAKDEALQTLVYELDGAVDEIKDGEVMEEAQKILPKINKIIGTEVQPVPKDPRVGSIKSLPPPPAGSFWSQDKSKERADINITKK